MSFLFFSGGCSPPPRDLHRNSFSIHDLVVYMLFFFTSIKEFIQYWWKNVCILFIPMFQKFISTMNRNMKNFVKNKETLFFFQFEHQIVGFDKDGDDFAVMRDIVVGKGAVLAVFEPLLGGLIAADVEVPG